MSLCVYGCAYVCVCDVRVIHVHLRGLCIALYMCQCRVHACVHGASLLNVCIGCVQACMEAFMCVCVHVRVRVRVRVRVCLCV